MIVKFFGVPRQQAGCESLQSDAKTVIELLRELAPRMGGKAKELAEGTSQLDGSLTILKNGRNIAFIDKLATELTGEDEVTLMGQIAGG